MMPDFATAEPKVEIRIPSVSADLRRQFKMLCASKNTTMGKRLQELIRNDLDKAPYPWSAPKDE